MMFYHVYRYSHATDGVILVYDITDRYSYNNMMYKWLPEVKSVCGPDIVIMVIGNKKDLSDNRQVSMDEAIEFAGI